MKAVKIELPKEHAFAEVVSLGDIHVGDPDHRASAFEAMTEWVMAATNRYTFIDGDATNSATKTSKSDSYESKMRPGKELLFLKQVLKPIAEARRLWGIVPGNHDWRVYKESGVDLMEELADDLGVPYDPAGILCVVKVGSLDRSQAHDGRPALYKVYFTHSSGGGALAGASFNKLEKVATFIDADVVVGGHTHMPGAAVPWERVKVDERTMQVLREPVVLMSSSSMLDWATYAEQQGRAPRPIRYPILHLNGRAKEARVLV